MADDAAKKDLRDAGREYESKLADALGRQSEPKPAPKTSYGMPLKSVYTPEDADGQDYLRDLLTIENTRCIFCFIIFFLPTNSIPSYPYN